MLNASVCRCLISQITHTFLIVTWQLVLTWVIIRPLDKDMNAYRNHIYIGDSPLFYIVQCIKVL